MFTCYLRQLSMVSLLIFYSLHASAMERDSNQHKRKKSHHAVKLEKKHKSENYEINNELYKKVREAYDNFDVKALTELLKENPDLNWTPSNKTRPLLYQAIKGLSEVRRDAIRYFELANLFIDANADVTITGDQNNLLHILFRPLSFRAHSAVDYMITRDKSQVLLIANMAKILFERQPLLMFGKNSDGKTPLAALAEVITMKMRHGFDDSTKPLQEIFMKSFFSADVDTKQNIVEIIALRAPPAGNPDEDAGKLLSEKFPEMVQASALEQLQNKSHTLYHAALNASGSSWYKDFLFDALINAQANTNVMVKEASPLRHYVSLLGLDPKEGTQETIKKLLQAQFAFSLEELANFGHPALFYMEQVGIWLNDNSVEIVKLLLDFPGFDLDVAKKMVLLTLKYWPPRGDDKCYRALFARIKEIMPNEDFDAAHYETSSPLYLAITKSNGLLFGYLMARNVPLEYPNDPESCLMAAAKRGNSVFVDELMRKGAQPDASTLMAAIDHNHENLAVELLDKLSKDQIVISELRALAAKKSMLKVLQKITTIAGNNEDFDRDYCITIIKAGNVDALRDYLDEAHLDAKNNPLNEIFSLDFGGKSVPFTLLNLAFSLNTNTGKEASLPMVKTLINHGANVNVIPEFPGLTPFGSAVITLNLPCIKEMVDASADPFVIRKCEKPEQGMLHPMLLISARLRAQNPGQLWTYDQIRPFLVYLRDEAIFLPRFCTTDGNIDEDVSDNLNTSLKAMCFRKFFTDELDVACAVTERTKDDAVAIAFIPKSGHVKEMLNNLLRVPEENRPRAIKELVEVLAKEKYHLLTKFLRYPDHLNLSFNNDLRFTAAEYPRVDEVDPERVALRNKRLESIKTSLTTTLTSRVNAEAERRSLSMSH